MSCGSMTAATTPRCSARRCTARCRCAAPRHGRSARRGHPTIRACRTTSTTGWPASKHGIRAPSTSASTASAPCTGASASHGRAGVITVGGTNGKGSTVASSRRSQARRACALARTRLRTCCATTNASASTGATPAMNGSSRPSRRSKRPAVTPGSRISSRHARRVVAVRARGARPGGSSRSGWGAGRLDATNIVDADVAVITTVDLDHTGWLGDDIESHRFEKPASRVHGSRCAGRRRSSAVQRAAPCLCDRRQRVRIGCDFFVDRDVGEGWRWREIGFEVELPMPLLAAPRSCGTRRGDRGASREPAVRRRGRTTRRAWRPRACRPGTAHRSRWRGVRRRRRPQPAGRARACGMARTEPQRRPDTCALRRARRQGHRRRGRRARRPCRRLAYRGTLPATGRGRSTSRRSPGAWRPPRQPVRRLWPDFATALAGVRRVASTGDRVLVFGSFHTAADALRALDGATCTAA